MEELLKRMRLLEDDHEPDGWPAVQMRDITALLDEIDRRVCIGGELIAARREREAMRSENTRLRRVLKAAVDLVCAPGWAGVSDEDVVLERTLLECGFVAHNP